MEEWDECWHSKHTGHELGKTKRKRLKRREMSEVKGQAHAVR